MGLVARWSVSTGPEKTLNELVPLDGVNVGRQKASLSGPHKMDSLGSHFSQSNVPPSLKRENNQTSPYGIVQTFDLFTRFHKQGTKFKKEKPNERDTQKHAPLPKHTPTQRLHSPMTTLKVVTSWWGAFVMLSKIENMF